jgi:RimJ/RimL family protein N-acetyltransferase/GNAT superfamily N-acetyltransferase
MLSPMTFTPIQTDRLLLRPFRLEDVASLHARRNDPDVARYQDWELPFTLHEAESMVASIVAMTGPADGEWSGAVVCDPDTGEVFGDVGFELTSQARTAELGYTFASQHWGNGYAAEAVEALVRYLFEDLGVTRVCGMLHPDNPASAMVMERAGLLFEGHLRSSYWLGDECSDDWIYGVTRPDWDTWQSRVRYPPADLRLVEVSTANEQAVSQLRTHKTQEAFVAPMGRSFTDALFPEVVNGAPVVPWMRAVEADGAIVGFVMVAVTTDHHSEPFLWRLLIDRLHQRRGIGGIVLELVADECRAMGDRALVTSWGEGKGSPREFYLRHGFAPTGNTIDGETEGRRKL